jgi:hypothetical protein
MKELIVNMKKQKQSDSSPCPIPKQLEKEEKW